MKNTSRTIGLIFILVYALGINSAPASAMNFDSISVGSKQNLSSAKDSSSFHDLKKKKKKKKKKPNPCKSISYDQIELNHDSWYPVVRNYSSKCDIKFSVTVSRCEAYESMDCNLNVWYEYDYVVDWVSKDSWVELSEDYGRDYLGNWDGYYYDFDLEILAISQ